MLIQTIFKSICHISWCLYRWHPNAVDLYCLYLGANYCVENETFEYLCWLDSGTLCRLVVRTWDIWRISAWCSFVSWFYAAARMFRSEKWKLLHIAGVRSVVGGRGVVGNIWNWTFGIGIMCPGQTRVHDIVGVLPAEQNRANTTLAYFQSIV